MTTESDARTRGPQNETRAIATNAAKVLETTRRAWSDSSTAPTAAPKQDTRRAPRALPKRRVVPRRSRWPSLIAALNYWSPKPL
ncbi:hypothetical protein [Caballeronia cordobensis]|uniref:hypothetical protein n=1 Tax=Caballeronia cordobensis TaxID=1353886 RepID=UPI00045EE3B8|nr:uncharacterized protein BRPE67_ACDS18650 [Burkholderia sp. RPE67]